MKKLKKIEMPERKKRIFTLLKELRQVCDTHGLRYMMYAGTLLGAVRHKGFIPWDDDIDICMPRPDYNKLIELHKTGKLKRPFLCYETDKSFNFSFGKYMETESVLKHKLIKDAKRVGLYVDVFPIDGLGKTQKDAKEVWKKLNKYKKWNVHPLRNWLKACMFFTPAMPLLFTRRLFAKKIDKHCNTHSFDNSNYAGFILSLFQGHCFFKKEMYLEYELLEFEGELFKAPRNWHEYLSTVYKNYMEFPPEHKRKTHNFIVYEIELSNE